MDAAIYIGSVDPRSVEQLSKSINDILSAPYVDNKTKQRALEILGKGVAAPNNSSISNCTFTRTDKGPAKK